MNDLAVSQVTDLRDVDRERWNELVGEDSYYLSHQFLLGQEDPTIGRDYVLVHDGDTLVGGLPLYRFRNSRAADYERMFGENGDLLFAGGRTGMRNQFLVRPGLAERTEQDVVLALVTRAGEVAAQHGYRGVAYDFLTGAGLRQLTGVTTPYVTFRIAQAAIDLADGGLEDYLARMPRRLRVMMRREMRRFAEAGWVLGEERLSDRVTEVAELLSNTERRYGNDMPAATAVEFLTRQIEHLDDHCVLFTCREPGGDLVGYSMMLRWRRSLYGRIVGFDYERRRGSYEYFNLAFYLPMRYMTEHGLRHLHLGIKSFDAKGRRGANFTPLWTAAVYGMPTAAAGTRWVNMAGFRAAVDELSAIPAASLPVPDWDLPGAGFVTPSTASTPDGPANTSSRECAAPDQPAVSGSALAPRP